MRGVVWPLVVTMAIQALVSMAVFSPPVLAPAAHVEIGFPASWVGLVTTLTFASATLGALFSGGVIARLGALRMSQLSLLLCGAGIALIASADPWLVALGALIMGAGYGPVTPSSSAILVDRTPEHMRAFIFSLKQTGVPIGGALAGAIVPALVVAANWKISALAVGVICWALAVAIQPYRAAVDLAPHRIAPSKPASLLEPLRFVLGHPRLREMGLASAAYSGMQACLATFLVVYLHQRVGFSVPVAGAALATAMSAGIVGRIAWGIVADHWVRPRALLGIIGLTMSACAAMTAAFSDHWPVAIVFAVSFVYGATAIGWNGVYLSEVARIAPAGRAGSATGASLAMTYAGVVVLPSVFWIIVGLSGSYAAGFLAAAALSLWRSSYFLRGR
ncbi:MAG TPA: MFS transporter [Burkholderiales bacterium]|jgi:MFS family permease|nr:MFS transporter [Burkholderiales bacterium]